MDTTLLIAEIATLRASQASLQLSLANAQQENKLLREKIQALIKRYFGRGQNEAIDPGQLELLLAGLDSAPPSVAIPPAASSREVSERKRVSGSRQPLPSHLPVEEVVIEPEEVRQNPDAWQKIGEEVTEELDWTPAQFLKRLYIRPKYARRAITGNTSMNFEEKPSVLIAPLPPRLIEKGWPGAGLMAHVLISKYEDHIPLCRQEKIYWERHGVKLTRAVLAEWVEQGAEWLRPIFEEIKERMLKDDYLQLDETPMRYLDPDLPGKAQMGYLWVYSRPKREVLFDWHTSRGREAPRAFLRGYRGRLQTDGYGVYTSLAKEHTEWVLIGCWAHARRKFFDALEQDRRAAWVIRQIAHLYGVEKRLREIRAGPQLRQAKRGAESRSVLKRIEKALRRLQGGVLPKSLFGVAIGYTLERWTELVRYVEDGKLEIDNNLVENAIRPTAVGKKNFLFIGHPNAGWRSAVIYSIIGSCRRLGINPHEYLRDVLKRLPTMKRHEVEQIIPSEWAKAKKATAKSVI